MVNHVIFPDANARVFLTYYTSLGAEASTLRVARAIPNARSARAVGIARDRARSREIGRDRADLVFSAPSTWIRSALGRALGLGLDPALTGLGAPRCDFIASTAAPWPRPWPGHGLW